MTIEAYSAAIALFGLACIVLAVVRVWAGR